MPVSAEEFIYLQLQVVSDIEASIALEVAPSEHYVDGLWIDTTLAIPGMPIKFSWFLDSMDQERLADIDRRLSAGTTREPFSVVDTDCSFDLTFVPEDSKTHVGVALSRRILWGGDDSAVKLTIDNCTATYADVHAFIRRMSSIE